MSALPLPQNSVKDLTSTALFVAGVKGLAAEAAAADKVE